MSKTADEWVQEASTLKTQNKLEDAIKAIDNALKVDSNHGRANFLKAFYTYQLPPSEKNAETTVQYYKKCISVGYNGYDPHYNIAQALMLLGRSQEAADYYRKAYALNNAKMVDIYPFLGQLLEELGKDDEAMELYNACITKSNHAILFKGNLLFRQGKIQDAINCYGQPSPGEAQRTFRLGCCYNLLGNKAKAMECFDYANRMNPTALLGFLYRGQCFDMLGKKDEAQSDFKRTKEILDSTQGAGYAPSQMKNLRIILDAVFKLEEMNANVEGIIENLGSNASAFEAKFLSNIRKLQEQRKEAQMTLIVNIDKKNKNGVPIHMKDLDEVTNKFNQEIAELKKEMEKANISTQTKGVQKTADDWVKDAGILKSQNKIEEAIQCIDKAIALSPNHGRGNFLKAFYTYALPKTVKNAEITLEYYKKCISVGYNGYDPHYNISQAFMYLGRIEEAVQYYKKAYELNKDKIVDIYPFCGLLLEELGKPDEAMAMYNACITKSNHAILFKGNLLLKQGKIQEAINCYGQPSAGECHRTYRLGSAYSALGNKDKAMECFNYAPRMNPTALMGFCYKGQCFTMLGKKEEALVEFKKAKEMLETTQGAGYTPSQIKNMREILDSIFKVEEASAKAEALIENLDTKTSSAAGEKFIANVKKLQQQKKEAQAKLLDDIDKKGNTGTSANMAELNRVTEEFRKEIAALQQEMAQVRADVKVIDIKVKVMENKMEEMKEELNNKLDDFNRKLDTELTKQDLNPEDKAKLKDYFKGFVGTFSSAYVTSQVIESGQVSLDTGSSAVTVLSMLASFTPFIGSALSSGVQSLGDFLQTKEMKTNARKIKGLAIDPTQLSQVIGKAAFDILMNKKKQQQVIKTTEKELQEISGNLFKKLSKLCQNISEKVDVFLYSQLYNSAAERVGHNDANDLIEKWVKEEILPFNVQGRFVEEILLPFNAPASTPITQKTESTSPVTTPAQKSVKPPRTSCCNMF